MLRNEKLSAILSTKSNTTSLSDSDSDDEEPFEMNLVNSTVYIVSMTLQVSTFAVNYRVSKKLFYLKFFK